MLSHRKMLRNGTILNHGAMLTRSSILNGRLRGTTLVELLAVLVLLALVGAAVMRIAVGQQRFLSAVDAVIDARRAARDGVDIPRQDLRAVAAASGGIYAMVADMIEFRSLIGVSVACRVDSSRIRVSIPARDAWSRLTSWVASPRAGDTVLVFDAASDSAHPVWHAHALTTDPVPGGVCPVGSGFARNSIEEAAALELQLIPQLEPTIHAGAALRFVRRARYQLYRAGDGRWYLGYLDCLSSRATPCSTIQPVSGPFASGGVRFAFSDSSGVPTGNPSSVARVDVVSHTGTHAPLRAMGFVWGSYSDSVVASVALRNR